MTANRDEGRHAIGKMSAFMKNTWHRVSNDKSLANFFLAMWLLGLVFFLPVMNFLDDGGWRALLQALYGLLQAVLFVFAFSQWKRRSFKRKGNPRYVLWFLALVVSFLQVMAFLLESAMWVRSLS